VTSSASAPITLCLPFTPSSVSVARQSLRDWMIDRGASPGAVEDARVIISELVANSVRHAEPLADGSIVVTWCDKGGRVQLSVTDGGSGTRPRNIRASSSAVSGRGMAIVEILALRWWSERTPSRSTVHAQLPA
jgi:serine/threonine-protein kinase RsbW